MRLLTLVVSLFRAYIYIPLICHPVLYNASGLTAIKEMLKKGFNVTAFEGEKELRVM